MNIELDYDGSKLTVEFPDYIQVDEYRPDIASRPLTYEEFKDLFSKARGDSFIEVNSPLIIVNDAHRNTPTGKILGWLDQYDSTLLERATFLIACGTHNPPDSTQFAKIFGPFYEQVKNRVLIHNTHDLSAMTKIGVDRFGEDVYVSSHLFKYEKALVITSVEPHYFAGFSGGRKSFFPGLTNFKTIERNHNLANSLDCQPLRIKGNPMAEHLDEMFAMVNDNHILGLQIVFDAEKRIVDLSIGSMKNSFLKGIVKSETLYKKESEIQYDLILSVLHPPLDRSLYQIQKGIENCRTAVKENGAVVLISACRDGIGSESFYKLAGQWDEEKNCARDGSIKFGSHKLSRVNAMSKRFFLGIYSKLEKGVVNHVFYRCVSDLQKFVNDRIVSDTRVAIVHDSGNMVLKFNK